MENCEEKCKELEEQLQFCETTIHTQQIQIRLYQELLQSMNNINGTLIGLQSIRYGGNRNGN